MNMDTIENIKTRRSIRRYNDEPIDHDVIKKIVDAATYSPSWKNTQIVRYNIIENLSLIHI